MERKRGEEGREEDDDEKREERMGTSSMNLNVPHRQAEKMPRIVEDKELFGKHFGEKVYMATISGSCQGSQKSCERWSAQVRPIRFADPMSLVMVKSSELRARHVIQVTTGEGA